jgi:hypothetical protein
MPDVKIALIQVKITRLEKRIVTSTNIYASIPESRVFSEVCPSKEFKDQVHL